MKPSDRYRGALLGLACGDAVGTTLEFRAPGTFEPIRDMVGGGPFGLEPGRWTDDTSMALCLATSLVEKRGFDAHDQMRRYVSWWREGYLSSTGVCFDIGNATRAALLRFEETGDPWAGSTDPRSAGNGSLMRLAPVPMFFAAEEAQAVHYSGSSSRTTHAAREAVDACRLFGAMLVRALGGASKSKILEAGQISLPGEALCESIAEIGAGSWTRKQPPEISGSGYVVRSLEAALWAFATTDDYRSAVLRAANLGDDADTTAAISGQLAGAHYGIDGIPDSWWGKLARAGEIERLADALLAHAHP